MTEPWPPVESEEQVAIHNARVAISRAEDELANFKDAEWLREVRESLDLATTILRAAHDHAG